MHLTILPEQVFLDWMAKYLKVGGQSKFPRVMSDALYAEWLEHVQHYQQSATA
jgi:hypothetical protein